MLDGLELQGVEGTAHGLQSLDRHMQIAGGGTDIDAVAFGQRVQLGVSVIPCKRRSGFTFSAA
jgi:hypothetical protein